MKRGLLFLGGAVILAIFWLITAELTWTMRVMEVPILGSSGVGTIEAPIYNSSWAIVSTFCFIASIIILVTCLVFITKWLIIKICNKKKEAIKCLSD